MSGGQAIEFLAHRGNRYNFLFKTPMGQVFDCNFSFAGLRNQVSVVIDKKELEEGMNILALKNIHIPKIQVYPIQYLGNK